jgi:Polyketide cyclase / dehydrase and lipid transport
MTEREPYTPGPAIGARIQQREGEKWTLVLVRELRHSPEKVWQALTDPAHLREWAPFVTDANLGTVGTVHLTWVGAPQQPFETRVTRAEAPKLLEYQDMRWELEAMGAGTRLTLWHSIDRRFIAMSAAGWHICFDVLGNLLGGTPIPPMSGPEVIKIPAFQRLHAEYRKLLGVEPPSSQPDAPR